jgi:phosphate transport system substrate-binding protein
MATYSFARPTRRGVLTSVPAWLAASLAPRALAQAGGDNTVQGQGASFPSKVYAAWAQRFAQASGIKVSYKATGSGDGVAQATGRKVQFGGTDTPLPAKELADRKLVQLPMLVGGIVPVVHLPGVGPNRLQLTGELLADLMLGRVERWDDARVVALNRGLRLPALRVARVVRADRSGTTEGFTRYLAQVSAAFAAAPGPGQAPNWPGDVIAEPSNDGVAAAVRNTPGGLGYVSFDRAGSDGLAAVLLRNRDGQFVAASDAGFRAAIGQSDLYRKGDDTASLVDLPGAQTWPITMTSFVLVDAEPPHGAAAEPALRFLYWCLMRGDELTRGTGFAPLPLAAQARFVARLAQVAPRDGAKPVYQTF